MVEAHCGRDGAFGRWSFVWNLNVPSGGDGFEMGISQKLKNLAPLLVDEILAPDWNNPTTKVCIISVNQK